MKEETVQRKMFGGTTLYNEIVYSEKQLRRNCKIKNLRPTTSCKEKVFLVFLRFWDGNCVVSLLPSVTLIIRAMPNPDIKVAIQARKRKTCKISHLSLDGSWNVYCLQSSVHLQKMLFSSEFGLKKNATTITSFPDKTQNCFFQKQTLILDSCKEVSGFFFVRFCKT